MPFAQKNVSSYSQCCNPAFLPRTTCLTKNYCSKECLSADKAVHRHCCGVGVHPLASDPRKWKKGKTERGEEANRNLKLTHLNNRLNTPDDCQATLSETMSKFKEVKVKKKLSEVD